MIPSGADGLGSATHPVRRAAGLLAGVSARRAAVPPSAVEPGAGLPVMTP